MAGGRALPEALVRDPYLNPPRGSPQHSSHSSSYPVGVVGGVGGMAWLGAARLTPSPSRRQPIRPWAG